MRSNPLDGPGMSYGPVAGADRRGSPLVTVVLALVCLLLAATLAFVLLRPTAQTAAPVVTVTATVAATAPTPGGTPAPGATPGSTAPTVATSASASPTPGGTDATLRTDEPEGVREAATTFLRGWLEPKKAIRVPLLQVSATDSLLDRLADVDPAKLPDAKPKGALVVVSASDFAAVADQKMSDGTTVRMELVYEPASRYGWLVDTVGPLE
jgi:hypothetical protein